MDKEFYDKYSDGLKCYGCDYLLQCKKSNSPILAKCIPNMNYVDKIIGLKDKITDLKAKLAEKDELLRQKINKMKSTDFIRMCVSCGFMVQAKEIDNQTAIAVLEEMLENEIYLNVIPDFECGDYVSSKIIKTKIEELKNGRN